MDKIESTFPFLEAQRQRFATAQPPLEGSPLDEDSKVFPSLPVGELGRQCNVAAWDHLDLARLTIERRRSFPTGTNSVLRGALVGAAQAVWLLHPEDSATRCERGLILAHEWYHRRIQYQAEVSADLADQADRQRSEEQLLQLKGDRDNLVKIAGRKPPNPNVTDIVRLAAGVTFAAPQARNAQREWRRLGGDAHALGWQLMLQHVEWIPVEGQRLAEARVVSDLGSVANAYLCAFLLFKASIERFDLLNEAPN